MDYFLQQLSIRSPDDWHCHLRDGLFLARTVADTAQQFERAIVMPNLLPPITNLAGALAYRERIEQAIPAGYSFSPLMTFYLTDGIAIDEIIRGKAEGILFGCKFYPKGATTHSEAGLTILHSLYPQLEVMQKHGVPLLIHSEAIAANVDIIAREAAFINEQVAPLVKDFPELRIVLEHISTKFAVDFVLSAPENVAATITPHHLLLNLNDLLANGIKPHYYCKPIVNRLADQEALIQAAISGNPKFFLGTDSAPHTRDAKECAVGCAGIYSAHAAIELYAQVFSAHQALDKLENFASYFGAKFYGLPLNTQKITLLKKSWQVPDTLEFGDEKLVPLFAGEILEWKVDVKKSVE